jgi:hypothetical protein
VACGIIFRTLYVIGEDRVGLCDLSEFLGRVGSFVPIRVIFEGKLAVSLFNLVLGCGAVHTQDFIVITFRSRNRHAKPCALG